MGCDGGGRQNFWVQLHGSNGPRTSMSTSEKLYEKAIEPSAFSCAAGRGGRQGSAGQRPAADW